MDNTVFGDIGKGIYKGEIVAVLVENLTIGFLEDCKADNILIRFSDGDYDVFKRETLLDVYSSGGFIK